MSTMEDLLFYTITEGKEMIPLSHFISVSQQHIYTYFVGLIDGYTTSFLTSLD